MRRTGIDLSSIRCNVVDAESSGRRRRRGKAMLRVHQFTSITHLDNAQTLTAELKALSAFSRRAWVNLWDVRSSHQYLLLPSAPDSELESRARRHGASGTRHARSRGDRRNVDWRHARRAWPPSEAGSLVLRRGIRGDSRAPSAHRRGRIYRRRRHDSVWSLVVAGEAPARIAAGRSTRARGARSVAIGARHFLRRRAPVCERSRLGLRGAVDGNARRARPRAARRSLVGRASAIVPLSEAYWEHDVAQVLLCGDMPEIRSLTAPLIERLNIEVETLDTLDGIDTATLPEGFAERAPMLRLASSIAVGPPPVNLLPVEVTASRTNKTGQHIVAAGTAAAVAIGAFLYGQANVRRLDADRQIDVARREMSSLQAQVGVAAEHNRRGRRSEIARRAALRALDAQGPAMARVLEALANAAPQGVTVKSLRAMPDGGHWNVSFDALAAGADELRAPGRREFPTRAAVVADEPLQPPTRRFVPDAGGVEIAAGYRVRK